MTRRKPRPAYTPGFVSRTADDPKDAGIAETHRAMRETDARAVAGIGWWTGTCPLPKTTNNKRPTWMVRPRDVA